MSAEATEAAWDELTLSPDGVPAGRRPLPAAAQQHRVPLHPSVLHPLPRVPRRPGLLVDLAQLQQGRAARLGEFVGFQNWREIAADTELTGSIKNTAIYAVEAIFLVFTLALLLALLLNRYRKGSNIFKLALYVPLLAPAVLVGLVWQFVTNYDFGLFNLILTNLGIDRINIFGNGTYALLMIVFAEVWRGLGFWTLYFLASLQSVPEELLDAARVDGAKGVQRFRRVTLPMLRPMLLFAVVIAIIANFQVFDTVYVLTQGGPYQSTSTIVWFIWKRLFQFQQTGQGYAAAVLLLGIILVLTALSFWLLGSRRRHERAA